MYVYKYKYIYIYMDDYIYIYNLFFSTPANLYYLLGRLGVATWEFGSGTDAPPCGTNAEAYGHAPVPCWEAVSGYTT